MRATGTTLTGAERVALLRLARGTVAEVLAGGGPPPPEALGIELGPRLLQPGGVFVTLRRDGALRGCIGEIHPTRPLWEAVRGSAVSAALRDYRFPRLEVEELRELELSISVLTAPEPVSGWEEIVLGRHGIVLRKESCSATFLPQVATEQGWDLERTLTQLSLKAGLPQHAWREGASFLVFEAETFGGAEA